MPAILDKTTVEAQILEAHNVELQNKAFRAQNAFELLDTYDWQGTGVMPTPIDWTAPTGLLFRYDSSGTELQYAGTNYSSLTPAQKREFFQYLPKFIAVCMDAYDTNYNL
jgi:hypothetical protein